MGCSESYMKATNMPMSLCSLVIKYSSRMRSNPKVSFLRHFFFYFEGSLRQKLNKSLDVKCHNNVETLPVSIKKVLQPFLDSESFLY